MIARLVVDTDPGAQWPYLVVVNERVIAHGDEYERIRSFVDRYNRDERVTLLRAG